MLDIIKGPVINIVDGDTFDMSITHVGRQNRYRYGSSERVRIAEIDRPELNTSAGLRSKYLLQERLLGKEVICHVQGRDVYRRIVGKVQVLTSVLRY